MLESTQQISKHYGIETRQLLDTVSAALDAREPWAVNELISGLHTLGSGASRDDFSALVAPVCRAHPLYERFAADPFVRRSRDKPRGYAGDAVMLDYMYDGLPEQEDRAVSEEGRALFASVAQSAHATHAVRERRTILARMIDGVANRVARPRILSVACGHLREAGKSRSVGQGHICELVALDQDAASLQEIARSAYGACVRPIEASILALLRGRVALGSFDLIYSAGLYDYLGGRGAQALTTRLFSLLNPGGRLLIGNFAQGLHDAPFMEAFMDWRLVLRTPAEMRALFAGVPSAELALRVYEDSLRNVLYADATRSHH